MSNHENSPHEVFVIYWPEDETWHDGAIDSVRRNRVTFMRYPAKPLLNGVTEIKADISPRSLIK